MITIIQILTLICAATNFGIKHFSFDFDNKEIGLWDKQNK